MKYLLVILIAVAVIWLWRSNRQAEKRASVPPRPGTRPQPTQPATEMVECQVCHVHLPRSEALIGGQGGSYCCEAHRRQAGG